VTVMQKPRTRQFRRVLLALLSLVLILKSRDLAERGVLRVDDFVAYWSAARLQLGGTNPYSDDQLSALHKSAGWTHPAPLKMYNPPWTFYVVLPFGLFSYPLARLLWLFLSVSSIVLAVDWAYGRDGSVPTSRRVSWGLAALFVPALMAVQIGQTSPLLLLGVVGFLACERRQKWLRAGVMLSLLAMKPHLFYLFWLALACWTINRRRWAVIAGGVLSLLASSAIALLFNSAVMTQYLEMIRDQAPPLFWLTPTLGTFIRGKLGQTQVWLQFVPMVGGAAWFFHYWKTRQLTWEWSREMPILVLVSMATTSYAWLFDQVVLLPFILQALFWVLAGRNYRLKVLVLSGYTLINGLLLILIAFKTEHSYYVWLAPVWLAGYLFLRARLQPTRSDAMPWTGVRNSAVR